MSAKPQNNLARMIQLAEEFFAVKNDPSQISINKKVMLRLQRIHPSTMTEKRTSNGPIAWILLIPTTRIVMEQFIAKEINERELFNKTPLHVKYDSIYLCSALVLPEYRGKGLAKSLMIQAIKSIQKEHPIHFLFSWAFSAAGKKLAVSVAKELSLRHHNRT
jgi:ribosomal protein S18 acetylase RimI-like enzyme